MRRVLDRILNSIGTSVSLYFFNTTKEKVTLVKVTVNQENLENNNRRIERESGLVLGM